MLHRATSFLLKPYLLFTIYILASVFVGIQLFSLGKHSFEQRWVDRGQSDLMNASLLDQFRGQQYTEYNNYVIFKNSFHHLAASKDMYTIYPNEQWDVYKYSPVFAIFMGAFAWMPDIIGLVFWCLLNALVLFFAICDLPFTEKNKAFVLWFIFIGLVSTLQAAQSNALIAGLMILSYTRLQKDKPQWAALLLLLACCIKPYAAIGYCLFLFFPGKGRFVFYTILWGLVLFMLPLLATPVDSLVMQYKSWLHLMAADSAASYGLSVIGWLHSLLGVDNLKLGVMLTGVVLFLLPLTRIGLYQKNAFRLYVLASMLVWVVLFNHKAETPTFIIAVAGMAVWYFSDQYHPWRLAVLIIAFIGVCLSTTDIFSAYSKEHFFKPYFISVITMLLVWFAINVQLLSMSRKN